MIVRGTVLLWAVSSFAGCGIEFEKPEPAAVATAPEETANAEPAKMVQVKAEAGEGAKGRGYGGGVISEPLRQRWIQEQKIIFDIQIPLLLAHYNAEQGHAPKTHEEFMEEIIRKGKVVLPELPEGHEYIFNPESQQLEILRPEDAAPLPVETPTIPFP